MSKVVVRGVKSSLSELSKKLSIKTKEELVGKSSMLVNQLRDATPVDTGEASKGWKLEEDLNGYKIVNDVEHISYLNEGSSKQAPRYFIEQTILKNRDFKPIFPIVQTAGMPL